MSKGARTFRRPLAAAAVASIALSLVGASMAVAVDQNQQSSFGRMFPRLEGFTPSDQSLTNLVQTQRDAGKARLDNVGVPAGFTYLGQFIDHDLTRNLDPLPAAPLDPTTLKNFRTAAFDLDSVYGKGPADPSSSHLYNADGTFIVQEANVNGLPDLARDANGRAILVEPRNDENVIISQIHLAVQMFHNRLIEEGKSFIEARRQTQWHYQWVVVNDYLPHVVGQGRVDRFLRGTNVLNEFYRYGSDAAPMTPMEFSTAIFRYGHSQVRDSYEVNDLSEEAPIKVFDLAPGAEDLRGGQNINERLARRLDRVLRDRRCAGVRGEPVPASWTRRSPSRCSTCRWVHPRCRARHQPSGPADPGPSSRYGIPSGQDVARAMGIPVLTNNQLGLTKAAYPDFNGEAPLWFYMLGESRSGRTAPGWARSAGASSPRCS